VSARRFLLIGFALLVLAAAQVTAQQARPTPRGAAPTPADDAAEQAPAEGEAQDSDAPPPEEPDLEAIERMLREDEEVLGGSGYAYDPGDRRDPFLSLLRVTEEPEILGPRPEGVPGLLIDEIEVTGVFVTPQGPVAQVQAADKAKSYLLHVGDDLYDGSVVAIRFDKGQVAEVVFRQDVRDPTAAKPFREVTKQLNPA
jgi:hypothetical protein